MYVGSFHASPQVFEPLLFFKYFLFLPSDWVNQIDTSLSLPSLSSAIKIC